MSETRFNDPIHRLRELGRFLPTVDPGIMFAPLVGVVAGLGAVAFQWMTRAVMHGFLHQGSGFDVGVEPHGESPIYHGPHHEGFVAWFPWLGDPAHFLPWALLIVLPLGGLLSGLLVYYFAPEAEGHGTDAAIDAYHRKRGFIRPQVPLIKMVASSITLGTGGSGGREGPIAQIGAGFGSFLATRLGLTDSQRRVLMATGVGAGIGAIFHAPLAGSIFAIEVLYRDPDFEAEGLIPAFLATTIAYCVYSVVFGFTTLFEIGHVKFDDPLLLLPFTALAMAMTGAAWLYVRLFYSVHGFSHRLKERVPTPLRAMVGAFLTALVGLGIYFGVAGLGEEAQLQSLAVFADGYGLLQAVLAPEEYPLGTSTQVLILLLVVGFGKMLTTSLTIGSGGSGGVFGPSMVVGGSLGGAVGILFHAWVPSVVAADQVPIFVLLGMASFFAAAAKTPVSTLIIVSEMTAGYALLLPSMWVCALAYLMSRAGKKPWSIFSEQVGTRADSPAHRGDFIIDVLEGLALRDAMQNIETRKFITVPIGMPLREMVRLVTTTRQSSFPVIDDEGKYRGLFGLNDFREFLNDATLAEIAVAHDLTSRCPPLLLQMDLSEAMARFAASRFDELPVVDEQDPDQILGMLRRADLIATYSARLMQMRDGDSEAATPPEAGAAMDAEPGTQGRHA